MSNIEVFDTTFAMTVLIIIAIAVPLILLFANWLLHPGRIKKTLIKGSAYECGLAHVSGTANERCDPILRRWRCFSSCST